MTELLTSRQKAELQRKLVARLGRQNDIGAPVGAGDGCGTVIPRYVTEADVRRIVREEIAAALKGTP